MFSENRQKWIKIVFIILIILMLIFTILPFLSDLR